MKLPTLLFSCFFLQSQTHKINTANKYSSRIVNGLPAFYGLLPWQVRVINNRDGVLSQCGGALVSDYYVLTSANCVLESNYLTLYFGALTPDPNESSVLVLNSTYYIIHQNFNSANLHYDVALIRLPEAITFDGHIFPIRIPQSDEFLPRDRDVVISGYGITNISSSTPSSLNYAQIKTLSNPDCLAIYGSEIVKDETLCASANDGLSGPCHGDGGSPLVYYDLYRGTTIHGILSFVPYQCDQNFPSGYTRIQSVASWVRAITGV